MNINLIRSYTNQIDASENTKKTYLACIEKFLNWVSNNNINSISYEVIIDYKNYLKSNYKARATNTHLTALKDLFKYLERKGFVNYAKDIKKERVDNNFTKDSLTIDQVKGIYNSINTDTLEGARSNAIFRLLIGTGLRECEIIRADIGDIRTNGNKNVLYVKGKGETEKTGNLYFVDVMLSDKNGTLVENARNYVTISVAGNAELVGIDNGDSTDYEEYVSENKTSHTRKLFGNRMVAIIRGKVEKPVFVVTAASAELPNTSIKYDGQNWIEAAPYNAVHAVEDFIPARKIEIIAEGSTLMNAKNREIKVTAKVLPENASIKEINWNPVLKECVSSDYIEVCNIQGKGTGVETAVIKANCDGECILRCTAKNGTNQDEVISDLGFTVEGIGNPKLNPYKLIEACRLNSWDESKSKPTVSLESGIQNRGLGATWVSFDKVDFGNEGADSIHIPIFSFDTELPVEVWDGKPGNGTTYEKTPDSTTGGECLGRFTYKHPSIYNTYSENVFTLSKRLFGVHTISIVIPTELVLHGFYFDKTSKALSKLRALDAKEIVGDTFTKTSEAVEGIGNNVNLDFDHMDFGETKATKLTICGKSNTENNSINVKFFGSNGINKTHVIEFVHTDDYEEKTFEIEPVSGEQKVSFVFLPGCNFDFKWFRFQ